MDLEIDWLSLVLRWMHIVAASAALGGTLFMRLALAPSIAVLDDGARKTLHGEVRRRWSKVVMAAITFLLVSGLVNFFLNRQMFMQTTAGKLPVMYNALFGIKFLLALVVFFISSALVGRGQATEKMRLNAKFWLSVNLLLLLSIVAISNVLRGTHVLPKDYKPTADKPAVAQHVTEYAAHG